MARPDQEAIEMFMSITGASEPVAIQKLVEHAGNLNEAVNAHFNEGDRNTHVAVPEPQDDLMEIDDPVQDTAPFVSYPRAVREIPIEVKDGNEQSGRSGLGPSKQDITGTAHEHGPQIHETVILDENDGDIPTAPIARVASVNEGNDDVLGGNSHTAHSRPSAPRINDLPDYGNDGNYIEEEMIRAAIEASKRDAEIGYSDPIAPMPDAELAHAVSLSLKTAEQEKDRKVGETAGPSEVGAFKSTELEDTVKSTNGRLEIGGSIAQDEVEDFEEQPLIRHRSRAVSSVPVDTDNDIEDSPPSSPQRDTNTNRPHSNENAFHLDDWGGISSLEHDEAVMLEAALFGGIPEGTAYRVPFAPHQFMQNGLDGSVRPYSRQNPRPPSPSLTAQRLIREQQDDEYLASLQADQEKELKAREEAEIRLLEEQAAREAALEEERRKEEETRRKVEEEQEMERQLAAKEASLPHEPSSDDENAVTLLVRMPDGSRRGRRFLKSHKLQYLFDFIDVGRVIKPGTYRLVRPYPRRAFGDEDSAVTLNELGLTSRQEALFLELI